MQIGIYEILGTLGKGGTCVVYRARDPAGREVALKVFTPTRWRPDLGARFERERRLLAALGETEGFVPYLDSGESHEGVYLVMPLVTGGTLRDRLARGSLAVEATRSLGIALAQALGRAHARGVVHRDLKPENILFTGEGRPVIADLGLAKHFDREAAGGSQSVSLSSEGGLRGTAGYMPPEQMADARSVGPPADVFSLGAVLYECLTGDAPFVGDNVLQVLGRVEEGRFERIRARRPEVGSDLAATIERALTPDPQERFADGLAFARALESRGSRRRGILVVLVPVMMLGAGAAVLALRSKPEALPAPKPRTPPARPVLEPLADLRARGEVALNGADWKAALLAYDALVEREPANADNWSARGVARGRLGDHRGDLADQTKAIELAPDLAIGWINLATARADCGDDAGALAANLRAVALTPDRFEAWQNLANTRDRMGDREGAEGVYRTALGRFPRVAGLWFRRGVLRSRHGDDVGGSADLRQAVALDPGLAEAFAMLAGAEERLGDHEAALAAGTRATTLDRTLVTAWINRGAANLSLARYDAAIEDTTTALTLDPRRPEPFVVRGSAHERKGEVSAARADFEAALAMSPEAPWAKQTRKTLEALPRAGR